MMDYFCALLPSDPLGGIKKGPIQGPFSLLAEREGFEPPEVLPSIVFKTTAIDHSAISPKAVAKLSFFLIPQMAFLKKVESLFLSSIQ